MLRINSLLTKRGLFYKGNKCFSGKKTNKFIHLQKLKTTKEMKKQTKTKGKVIAESDNAIIDMIEVHVSEIDELPETIDYAQSCYDNFYCEVKVNGVTVDGVPVIESIEVGFEVGYIDTDGDYIREKDQKHYFKGDEIEIHNELPNNPKHYVVILESIYIDVDEKYLDIILKS